MSIFSNSSHLEWKAGLSDIIVKGTLPAKFGLIWLSGFRGKDLKVIFYQNLSKFTMYNGDNKRQVMARALMTFGQVG